jgi:hypothetical protein
MKIKAFFFLLAIATSFTLKAQVDPDPDLKGYYPFNGNANDESQNTYNGIIYGAGLVADRFGNPSKAYEFNGVDNWIDIGNNVLNGARTISVWFKPGQIINSSLTDSTALIYRDVDGTASEAGFVFKQGTGKLIFRIRLDSKNYQLESDNTEWMQDTWYHALGTVDGTTGMKLYINGVLQSDADPLMVSAVKNRSEKTGVGRWGKSGLGYFKGVLDDIRIYTRSLTEAEALELFHENGWVGNSSSYDLGISWLSPLENSPCGTGLNEAITVRINNLGTSVVSSFNVAYKLNSSNLIIENVDAEIVPGDSLDFTFRSKEDLSESTSYSFEAMVSISDDINPLNNQTKVTVTNNRMNLSFNSTNSECNKNTGAAEVIVSGGASPYNYFWTTGETTKKIENLNSGAYQVNVTDNNNCIVSDYILISDTGGPQIQESSTLSDVSCFGGNDGRIELLVDGGLKPYTYRWSSGSTSPIADNLIAGSYTVSVMDDNDCSTRKSFIIRQPKKIILNFEKTDTDCGLAEGKAKAIVYGGTAPYTYLWSNAGTLDSAINLSGGIYSLNITDSKSCSASGKITINEIGAPEITLVSIEESACGAENGAIFIDVSGGTGTYDYSWSNSDQTKNLVNVAPGDYTVEVSIQGNACKSAAAFTIPSIQPLTTPICMVTVDEETDVNMIVWQKPEETDLISAFNIYREGTETDVYQLVGRVPVNMESIYTDTNANPTEQAWKYRLSTMDVCGGESDLSDYHKTIHLTINKGTGDDFNLIWKNYVGIDLSTYNIKRYTSANGWEDMKNIAADFDFYNSWTDNNVPVSDIVYYVVSFELEASCISSKKAQSHNSVRSNKTKSNVKFAVGLTSEIIQNKDLKIYPNPNSGMLYLEMNLNSNEVLNIRISDLQGKILLNKIENVPEGGNKLPFDLSGLDHGIYLVNVITSKESIVKSIIVQ